MIQISTTDSIRGADALMRSWDCAVPRTEQDARQHGYAIMVSFYPGRIGEITATAQRLEAVIDAALEHQPDVGARIDGEALADALDTSDNLLVEVVCNLCGLVRYGSHYSPPEFAHSLLNIDVDAMYDRPEVVILSARRK